MAEEYIAVILVPIAIMYFLFYLAIKMDEKHHPIKLFFLWIGVILMVPTQNLLLEIAIDATMSADVKTTLDTIYFMVWIIMIITSAYFMIYVFRTSLEFLASNVRPFKRK
jgi:nucleoside recognition membrane protein YjiH